MAGLAGGGVLVLRVGYRLMGRYSIVRVLGRGGMGCVYLANDEILAGKPVAIKEMQVNVASPTEREKAVELFRKEARLLAGLDHPNLVAVTDTFEEDDKQYLVMAYVEGQSLEAVLDGGSPDLDTVTEWMDQVCDVLAYLHGRTPPVIFRDLKPSNVMLDVHNRIRVIDFGIARALEAGAETSTLIKGAGSMGYAPIEQYGIAATDGRADVYALGATAYSILTCKVPPPSVDLATGATVLLPPSQINAAVPRSLDAVILKMMAPMREDRYQTVEEVRAAWRATREPKRGAVRVGNLLQGQYRIDRPMADALLGRLFTASQGDQTVVIKRMEFPHRLDARQLAQFRRDMAPLVWLSHPHLAGLKDSFEEDGEQYLVLPCIEGYTLERIAFSVQDPIDLSLVLRWAEQLCSVLEYLHQHQPPIVFRNLHPANVRIDSEGKLYLFDPSLARVCSDGPNVMAGVGVEGYTALEQWEGTPGIQADIYSLGCVLYCLLTHERPPDARQPVRNSVRQRAPHAPGYVLDAIERMMAPRPADRFGSIAEVRAALAPERDIPALVRKPLPQVPPPPPPPDPGPSPAAISPPSAPAREVPAYIKDLLGRRTEVTLHAMKDQVLTVSCPYRVTLSNELKIFVPLNERTAERVSLFVLSQRVYDGKRWAEAQLLEASQDMVSHLVNALPRHEEGPLQRRKHPRLRVAFQVTSRDLPEFRALAMDLSATGIRLHIGGPIAIGTPVELVLDLAEDDAIQPVRLTLRAEARWCNPDARRGCQAGFEFARVPPAAQKTLERFLQEQRDRR
ncbi:MAG: protein kinase domain-containing protein [Candidatus Xenobia bacterium]